jgi:hypothetical protein
MQPLCLATLLGQCVKDPGETIAEIRSSLWEQLGRKAMASARLRTRVETPHTRTLNARRQLAVRQLYRLNREFDTQIAVLSRRSRYRGAALITFAALSLVGLGELMLYAPSCTDGTNIPTILIGGAIKVVGC